MNAENADSGLFLDGLQKSAFVCVFLRPKKLSDGWKM